MDETGNTGEKAAVLQVVGKAYESLGKPMQALSYMNRYIELYGELSKSEDQVFLFLPNTTNC